MKVRRIASAIGIRRPRGEIERGDARDHGGDDYERLDRARDIRHEAVESKRCATRRAGGTARKSVRARVAGRFFAVSLTRAEPLRVP
jgi:hypothetical protein